MRCLIFLVAIGMAAASASAKPQMQYFHYDYQPPQAMVQVGRGQPRPQADRSLSGHPQNHPQSMPVGYSDPQNNYGQNHHGPPATPGCKTHPTQYDPQQQQQQQPYQPQPYQGPYAPMPHPSQSLRAPKALYSPPSSPQNNQIDPNQNQYPYMQPAYRGMPPQQQQQSQQQKPRYPLTPPSLRYKIGLIADLGKDSKTKNGTFMSYLREGHLIVRRNHGAAQNESSHNVTVEFKEDVGVQMLETGLNNAGRGFDLSTLNVFNGDLYTCDDQTGIVYKLGTAEGENVTATPWVILPNPEGNGTRNTFKCEWATVKDNELWIGSLGTALDKDGNEVNDRLCIRKLSPDGFVTTVDWTQNYEQLGKALDIDIRTGFVAHESGAWSDLLQKWVFLPRRVSEQKFDEATINNIGSNVALLADDQFSNVEVKTLGELNEKSGFTSFKFIPDSEDQLILALKAETEEKGKTGSFLAVYDLEGKEIMEPVRIADGIYAGVEFL